MKPPRGVRDQGRSDRPEWEGEYEQLDRSLRALALRLVRDEGTADDVVQEAWMAALDAAPGQVRQLESWLRRVVVNLARRLHSSAFRRRDVEEYSARSERFSETPALEMTEVQEMLVGSVEELREPYRRVLRMRYLEGKGAPEIAAFLAVPESTVRTQLGRGITELREALDRSHRGSRSAWLGAMLPFAAPGTPGGERRPLAGEARVSPTARRLRNGLVAGALGVATVWLGTSLIELRPVDPVAPLEPESRDRVAVAEAAAAPQESGRAVLATRVESSLPSTAAEEVRLLEVLVKREDGSPAIDGRVMVWGPEWPIPDAANQRELWYADLEGRVVIPLREDQLAGVPAFAPGVLGVSLQARDRDEAWSYQHRTALPREGATQILFCRGPAQDMRLRVVDAGGAPVPGAFVVHRGDRLNDYRGDGGPMSEDSEISRSDERGEAYLRGLPMVEHRMRVRVPGKPPVERIVVGDAQLLEASFVVPDGETVYGRVELPDGVPAGGARVWLPEYEPAARPSPLIQTTTDGDGYFELTGLTPGLHVLFACSELDPEQYASGEIEVRAGEENVWEPTLVRRPPLEITIVDEDRRPVPGAVVTLIRFEDPVWEAAQVTDERGRSEFHQVPEGSFVLWAFPDTRATDRTVRNGITRDLQQIEVAIRTGTALCTLAATLVDDHGTPLSDARLVVHLVPRRIFDAPSHPGSGLVRMRDLAAGQYLVSVRRIGMGQHLVGELELRAGTHTDLGEVRVPSPVEVHLDWRDDRPLRDRPWEIDATSPGQSQPYLVRTLQEPVATLRLLPSRYLLRPMGPSSTIVEFDIPANQQQPLRVVVE